MSRIRQVSRVFRAVPTIEGAGVRLKRAFGHREVPVFDPFLLLDDFHSKHPADYRKGFPWHPHRGIDTITYVLHGRVEHGDSMGNSGTIGEGDVQWMTAGSGIIHQEMPDGDNGGLLWGFQLWSNLPAKSKMTDPRYRGVTRGEIPEVKTGSGARVKVIAGTLDGVNGPVTGIVTGVSFADLKFEPVTFYLKQNFPNPFNPSTSIQYAISSAQFVKLTVYDLLGREIETLVNEEKPAGTYEVTWYAEQLPSGVYFYQLRAGEFIQTKKMLLLK